MSNSKGVGNVISNSIMLQASNIWYNFLFYGFIKIKYVVYQIDYI